jgi:ribonuclease VapC
VPAPAERGQAEVEQRVQASVGGIAQLIRRDLRVDADTFLDAIDTAEALRISAANHLEAAIVVDSARDPVASRRFDQFIAEAGIQVEPVTPSQVRIARDAFRDYGKGSGHKASLDFGDCFAYALAKETGERLLFKGDDFGKQTSPQRLTAADALLIGAANSPWHSGLSWASG